jgi:hypothetical protein
MLEKRVQQQYINTNDNVTDIGTKSLDKIQHLSNCSTEYHTPKIHNNTFISTSYYKKYQIIVEGCVKVQNCYIPVRL